MEVCRSIQVPRVVLQVWIGLDWVALSMLARIWHECLHLDVDDCTLGY